GILCSFHLLGEPGDLAQALAQPLVVGLALLGHALLVAHVDQVVAMDRVGPGDHGQDDGADAELGERAELKHHATALSTSRQVRRSFSYIARRSFACSRAGPLILVVVSSNRPARTRAEQKFS